MGKLQIRVFGTPEVRHEGQIVKFRSRKVLALLLYLAVEGHKAAREKISAMLWPESDEAAGRSTLRRALADLRTALDESSNHTHLVVERDMLAFAFAPGDEVDMRRLDEMFDPLRRPLPSLEQTTARQALLSQLEQAEQLLRGDFLESFTLDDAPDFEQWASQHRTVWQRRASLIYERLAQLQEEQGDIAGAIETTGRWLIRDPLQESAYQRLMLLYLTAGNYRAALSAYEECRRTLAEELRTRPLPETQALVERIRREANAAAEGEQSGILAASAAREISESGVAPSTSTALTIPVVGRAHEHALLVDVYRTVQHRQTKVVILTGEAGIGKTQLTRNFLAWASAHGADVLQARAFETGGRLPYQPLIESFRPRLERENAPDDLLSDTWLTELARLFPELRDRYPDLPAVTGDEMTARARLYEALTRLGLALAEKRPVILFLDDLHWADTATLDVLYYAARRWQESSAPLLLLLSLRSENLARTNNLAEWITGLERDVQAIRLSLEALTLEETLQLLKSLALDSGQQEQVEAFGRWLFAETQGQPLYITETLKALLEHGILTRIPQADNRWRIDFRAVDKNALRRILPPGVREVIRVRLNQLTPDAFALLVAGAVLGRNASFEQLCQVAGLSEQAGLDALDGALRLRFLRDGEEAQLPHIGISNSTYFFTHDKVRDVVYSEAGEARRRVFHRRALEGLSEAPAGERGQHALAAGLYNEACRLYVQAGDNALQIFAINDAIAFYESALRLLAQLQETASLAQQLYSQLGRTYELASRSQDAERIYQEMLNYAQQNQLTAMECIALSRMAILAVQFHLDFEQANALLQQALRKAEEVNDRALIADLEWHLAQVGFYDFAAPTIVEHSQRALKIARELDARELMARCLNALSYGKKQSGHLREAEEYAQESLQLYQTLGNRAMEVDCMCVVADILLNRGHVEEAFTLSQNAYELAVKIGNAWSQVNAMYHLAFVALERGAYEEALNLAQRCVAITEEFKLHALQVNGYILLGIAQRKLQNIEEACATHLRAVELGQDMASPALIATAAGELCADYALLDRWEDAAACALQEVNGKSDLFVLVFGLSRRYLTEVLIRAGHVELAAQDLEHWKARLEESTRHHIPYLRAVAALALAQGEKERARAALQEAAELTRRLGLRREEEAIESSLSVLS